ncbi:16S rRNA (guanine(966)-N(2))-methyltransferase RsmD [Mollicutes bacterium LVI A0039]|nr:16S rRNA (guanine(966)-N(2))-methyltransferase RsmD [Mollicutes bacterium LVI A0039]
MRIISGKYKGRRLAEPKTMDIRPTTDRAKEGLFSTINFYIEGSDFLDLFSGAGGIAFEAASRYANRVVAVDNSKESARVFKLNEDKMNTGIEFYNTDVLNFLDRDTHTYDYIFMDPPYDLDVKIVEEILEKCVSKLNEDGELILEFSSYAKLNFENLEIKKQKKYGKSTFFFLREK